MARSDEHALSGPFLGTGEAATPCQHPDCGEAGNYRAPVGRDRPNEFYRFCLEHVRAYNKEWDYYRGMSLDEIEKERGRDATWQRPTWRLGGASPHAFTEDDKVVDPLGVFSARQARSRARARTRKLSEEEKALDTLGLKLPCGLSEVRTRYKELVKRLHPDANGGDRAAEERLKLVNHAYSTLKAFYA
jgi:hypothetical protein